jgi:hypothetical protein
LVFLPSGILHFTYFSAVTACTTFASAVSYAFMRYTYKFAHRDYDHQGRDSPI